MSRWDDSNNPFLDDDSWGRPSDRNGTDTGAYGGFESPENRRDALLQKIKDSEERQLASQQRSLVHLNESEQMGIATAEELVKQGEQLDNIEEKTTEINETMKTTQRHINSIKSVFGGFKNWFSKKESNAPPPEPVRKKSSRLNDFVENDTHENELSVHPAIRLREQDTIDGPPPSAKSNEEKFDENLGLMSSTLSRLKNMGMAFNEELDTQNDQIERINMSVDRADGSVNRQTRQIQHILYK